MTIYLSIKGKYLDQIIRGSKTNEYRDLTDYYTRRLVRACSKDKPKDTTDYVKCSDGKWRLFHKYDDVMFIESGGQRKERYAVKAIDVEGSKYVIRLGKRLPL